MVVLGRAGVEGEIPEPARKGEEEEGRLINAEVGREPRTRGGEQRAVEGKRGQ